VKPEDRQTQLNEQTNKLLQGPLKHARAAALALSLVPLASVAAAAVPAGPCDYFSGGLGGSLVDPVPDLIGTDGRRVTTDPSALSRGGRWVDGVAADGVSQVVDPVRGGQRAAAHGHCS
jgi:hypothetical protein